MRTQIYTIATSCASGRLIAPNPEAGEGSLIGRVEGQHNIRLQDAALKQVVRDPPFRAIMLDPEWTGSLREDERPPPAPLSARLRHSASTHEVHDDRDQGCEQ
jgi:hypothetical protein